MGDKARAVDFFRQLDIFSDRYAELNFGAPMRIEHGGRRPGVPWKGAVLHYTASDDLDSSLRWFLDERSKVSAHVIVCDRKHGAHEALAEGLDIVARLPATVIQCRTPAQGAWHARAFNDSCYGVECVSAGRLRYDGGEWQTWTGTPWSSPYKDAVELYGQWWVPYPFEQIEAVVAVLRYLRALGEPNSELRKPYVVGHSNAQWNKLDPGPSFPMHEVRRAIWDDWRPIVEYEAMSRYRADLRYGAVWRDEAVIQTVRAIASSEGNSRDPSSEVAWSRAWAAWAGMKSRPKASQVWAKLGLHLLGYAITSCAECDWAEPSFDTDDLQSVSIFQRMAGLQVDGIVGPVTARALEVRLWEAMGVGGNVRVGKVSA